MLYWSDPPQIRNCGLRVEGANPLPSSNAVVEDSVGNKYPSCVVTPNGLKNFMDSGRNPKPLAASHVGVRVVNGSAPIARLPVPPQRMSSAADMANSPSASLMN